jgi:DNA replication protein DnaC
VTDTDEPAQVGALVEHVARIAAKPRPEPTRPAQLAPDDFDYDPGAMLEERRSGMWSRAIPSRFLWADLADFTDQPGSVRAGLAEWAANPAARNLVLLGPVGVGKTHAAVAACRPQAIDHGTEVVFTPVVELLDMLRPGGPEHALADLGHADLLVIDDLGSERPTDWTAERLYALVNRRWLEERPTVATSNLEPEPLREALGERVFSRLVGNDAMVLRLTGHDRRRKQK